MINDTATRYATIRLMQLDARVWPWRNRGKRDPVTKKVGEMTPYTTARTVDEVLKGFGMVLSHKPTWCLKLQLAQNSPTEGGCWLSLSLSLSRSLSLSLPPSPSPSPSPSLSLSLSLSVLLALP